MSVAGPYHCHVVHTFTHMHAHATPFSLAIFTSCRMQGVNFVMSGIVSGTVHACELIHCQLEFVSKSTVVD